MKYAILALLGLLIFGLLIGGCTNSTTPTNTDTKVDQPSQNGNVAPDTTVQDYDSTLIDENSSVEIGEMI